VRRAFFVVVAFVLLLAPAPAQAADPLRGQQWNLDLIGVPGAHTVTRGDGAVVAVVDTGIDAAHEDLQGRLLPPANFVTGKPNANDEDGHGTHVTGIVSASTDNGIGIASVAPGARVLPIRVLDEDGSGSDSDVARGIDHAIAQRVQVINLSLGGNALSSFLPGGEFGDAIQRAVDAGIVVVAAAGNDSIPLCEQPEVRGKILCVGAVDRSGMRAFYSSGDSATIMAPGGNGTGDDILSTIPGSKYDRIAGTSQAAPHVSGVAALLVARGVRGSAAIDRILATARDAGMPGNDPIYGAGILDANAALAGLGGGSSGGGGSAGGGSAGGGGTTTKVVLASTHRIRVVLRRRAMSARCRVASAGTCRVTVRRGRTVLARGARRLAAGQTAKLRVGLTRAGKRRLQRGRRFRATAVLAAPGADTQGKKITFRR
jgi:subtilisin family serine protease